MHGYFMKQTPCAIGLRWVVVATLMVALATPAAHAGLFDIEWDLRSDKEGIQVYTGDVDGSKLKAVKAYMEIEVSLGEIVALVRDPEACPDWAELCKLSEHLEVTSETEMLVYTLNDLPWPVSDRDAVAQILWSQDPQTLKVEMSAKVTPEGKPRRKGTVRIGYGVTGWSFTPLGNGRVAVESLAHLDPGGATPAWLTNRLLVDAPHQTLSNMRELLRSKKYEGATFEFLAEPTGSDAPK